VQNRKFLAFDLAVNRGSLTVYSQVIFARFPGNTSEVQPPNSFRVTFYPELVSRVTGRHHEVIVIFLEMKTFGVNISRNKLKQSLSKCFAVKLSDARMGSINSLCRGRCRRYHSDIPKYCHSRGASIGIFAGTASPDIVHNDTYRTHLTTWKTFPTTFVIIIIYHIARHD